MTYDFVVVGGGIGGLTVASLLAARGISVCLLERQSQVGGCVANVQFGEHQFEPGLGIYSGWGEGEIHRRIFSELPVSTPPVSRLESELAVRLADGTDVRLFKDDTQFSSELRRSFPECSDRAVNFYQDIRAATHTLETTSFLSKAVRLLRSEKIDRRLISEVVADTSPRFKGFLDAQLRVVAGTTLEETAFWSGRPTFALLRQNLYAIEGGPAALAERLADSIKTSGSKVRLDSPVLRLAFDDGGRAVGVDLLSGETVAAKHGIISNLTVWDTYGKLVGLNRTPPGIKAMLSSIGGTGVYQLFASLEEAALARLPTTQLLFAPDVPITSEETAFSLVVSPDLHAPVGKRSVTITTQVDVNDWFRYQSSPEDLEEWDQVALEEVWTKLHDALPEMGAGIEVIETANPRTYYDSTRRKLGMVLGIGKASTMQDYTTHLPNLFIVGDTVSPVPTLASVSQAARDLADRLTS